AGSTMTQPTDGFGQTCPSPRSAKRSAARIWSRSVALFDFAKLLDEGLEILRLAEVPVNRGEADVGDLVEVGQRVHDDLADGRALDLVLARAFQAPDDTVDDALQPLAVDRPLAQRDLHRPEQLLAIERLALAGALYHHELTQLHALERREPRAAIGAL